MRRLARAEQSRRVAFAQRAALAIVVGLLALPSLADASPPAQGQYTLRLPGSSTQSPAQTAPGSPSSDSGSGGLIVLVIGLVAIAGGAGAVAFRRGPRNPA